MEIHKASVMRNKKTLQEAINELKKITDILCKNPINKITKLSIKKIKNYNEFRVKVFYKYSFGK